MNNCKKHGWYDPQYSECPLCAFEERDRLRDSFCQTDAALQLVRKSFEDSADEADALREERDRLRSIVAECLRIAPVGHIPTHDAEHLPQIVADLSEQAGKASALVDECDRLRVECDGIRKKYDDIVKYGDKKLYGKMLLWRQIEDGYDEACSSCGGSGVKSYASTAAWSGGIGGMTMTSSVCDSCWGSGKTNAKWINLKEIMGKIKELDRIRDDRDRLREERNNAIAAIEVWQREFQAADAEVSRLRDLIPQAWEAAQKRMTPNRSLVGAPPVTFREWMESKGLL